MEFKRLADVEALTEIPEGANAFVEVNGEIKRVPGEGLGGAGGFKTAVIKSSIYDKALAYVNGNGGRVSADPEPTYSCINMTFEEAYATVMSGEVLKVVFMDAKMGPMILDGFVELPAANVLSVGYILGPVLQSPPLYWTADGISTEEPGGGR